METRLVNELGLAAHTASFFVHRRKPVNNDYWLNRKSYVSLSTGYIFIPVFFDMLVKKGIAPTILFNENLLLVMELILQSAGRMEYKKISIEQHIEDCRRIVKEAGCSIDDLEEVEVKLVQRPFTIIPARYESLRRANTFLYTFCGQQLNFETLFSTWESLLPLMLMLDDFADVEEDRAANEENCLLDGGPISDNLFELIALCDRLVGDIAEINENLATYLRKLKGEAVARNMMTLLRL